VSNVLYADSRDAKEFLEHEDCEGGKCGYCEGGSNDCVCPHCDDDHEAPCSHCDETGKCDWKSSAEGRRIVASVFAARKDLESMKLSTHFPLTRIGFIEAFTSMTGGVPPSENNVKLFSDVVASLVSEAGLWAEHGAALVEAPSIPSAKGQTGASE